MRVGLSLTLAATLGRHNFQSTLGWSAVADTDEETPEGDEDLDLTSERVPVGFRVAQELEEQEDEDERLDVQRA